VVEHLDNVKINPFSKEPKSSQKKIINEIDKSTSSIKEFLSYIKGGKKKEKKTIFLK
jgi:hypothetical protein